MTDATPSPAPETLSTPDPATRDQRNWAMLCHIVALSGYVIPFANIFGPLVMWLLKREEWELVDDQGKESLNFQITWTIYLFISIALCFVLVGFVLLPVVILGDVILVTVAAVKASEGRRYRYPLTIRFLA